MRPAVTAVSSMVGMLNVFPELSLITLKRLDEYIGPCAFIASTIKLASVVGTVNPPAEFVPPV